MSVICIVRGDPNIVLIIWYKSKRSQLGRVSTSPGVATRIANYFDYTMFAFGKNVRID